LTTLHTSRQSSSRLLLAFVDALINLTQRYSRNATPPSRSPVRSRERKLISPGAGLEVADTKDTCTIRWLGARQSIR
jgi:hypothetical protein